MAYAGRTPTTGFRSIATKDTFSGDGSTVAFTLSLSTRTNDVEVFVENVQQEPTTAYSISGNTLTFTSAPVSGTDNIYVVYRGEAVQDGVHTPTYPVEAEGATINGDLAVDTDTLYVDATNNRVGIGTSSPADVFHISHSSNASNYGLTLENTYNISGGSSIQLNTILFKGDKQHRYTSSGAVIGDLASIHHEYTYPTPTVDSQQGGTDLVFSTASPTATVSSNTLTERMRIDSNGLVGIGTSPSKQLHILNTSTGSTATSPNHLRVEGNNSNYYDIGRDNAATGYLSFYGSQSGANGYIFGGANGERMRIDSNGSWMLGTTSSTITPSTTGGTKNIQWDTSGRPVLLAQSHDSAAVIKVNQTFADSSNRGAIRFYRIGTEVGSIFCSPTATTYNTSSDYRLKENVVDMTGAIDRVKALKPSQFNFIADPDTTVDGFIAHEVQDIVPEAVTGEKDAMRTEEYEVTPAVLDDEGNVVTEAVMGTREVPDYQGIDQAKLVPLLTGALQEAIARIETLEAEVATLKGASA